MIINAYYLDDDPPAGIAACIEMFDKQFFSKFSKDIHGKFWVAGGALRSYFMNEQPRDVDIYCDSDETRVKLLASFGRSGIGASLDHANSTILTRGENQYDLVKKTYDSPDDTLRNFDLNISMCATDGVALYCTPNYFIDLSTKNLQINLNATINPLKTLQRIMRYSSKGFTVPTKDLSDFLYEVQNNWHLPKQDVEEKNSDSSQNSSKVVPNKKFFDDLRIAQEFTF